MKKIYATVTALLAAAAISGCGGGNGDNGSSDDLEALKKSGYPIKTETTLKAWSYRGGSAIGQYSNPLEYPSLKNYMEKLGVNIEWTFATAGQEKQQFNLLLASDDLPDLMGWYWTTDTPGGVENAIRENYIASLDDLVDDYAPNFKKFLDNNPDIVRDFKTDEGHLYYVPSYVSSKSGGNASAGYIFRKDWLDELGLPLPETIDDWTKTLRLFKEKKGCEAPLTTQASAASLGRGLAGTFGMQVGWYHDDNNKVKFGYAEPEYKKFLETMNMWYNEGLLDRNLATIDQKGMDAKMLNGKSGASFNWITGGLGRWLAAGKEADPSYDLVGVKFPVLNKGDVPRFTSKDAQVYMAGYAIAGSSNHKELAMKVLDYGFSDEGKVFLQYGIEGETYNIKDGYLEYTDLITNNKDGLSKSEAGLYYIRNMENFPVVKDEDTYVSPSGKSFQVKKQYDYQQQFDAFERWNMTDAPKYNLPFLAPSAEDYGQLNSEINSYVDEMNIKFITGAEPLSNYDKFIAELNARGLPRLKEIMQDAYDKYLER